MNLHPSSFWFDGCCFKCTHYTHRHCNKHNTDIQGDCEHKCDEYELSKDSWHMVGEVTRRVDKDGWIRIDSCEYAHRWNGQPQYTSWYA